MTKINSSKQCFDCIFGHHQVNDESIKIGIIFHTVLIIFTRKKYQMYQMYIRKNKNFIERSIKKDKSKKKSFVDKNFILLYKHQ